MVAPTRVPTIAGLFIDIESVPGGEIFALGVTRGDTYRREALNPGKVAELVRELRSLATTAGFVAGHNINVIGSHRRARGG